VIPCVKHVDVVRTLRAADVAGGIVRALALEDQVVGTAAEVAGSVVRAVALEDQVVRAMAAVDVADGVVGALALEDDIVRAVAAVDMAEGIVGATAGVRRCELAGDAGNHHYIKKLVHSGLLVAGAGGGGWIARRCVAIWNPFWEVFTKMSIAAGFLFAPKILHSL